MTKLTGLFSSIKIKETKANTFNVRGQYTSKAKAATGVKSGFKNLGTFNTLQEAQTHEADASSLIDTTSYPRGFKRINPTDRLNEQKALLSQLNK